MKKLSKIFAVVLVLAMALSILPMGAGAIAATAGATATLVTDASALAAGDQIVIVAKDANNALSTNQKPNNRGVATVTKNGDSVVLTADAEVLTLKTGASAGTFAFSPEDGKYLYAASNSNNHLKTGTTLNAAASFTITISGGVASIVSADTSVRGCLFYNQSSTLFACYASTTTIENKDVQIYKLGGGSVTPPPTPSASEGTIAQVLAGAANSTWKTTGAINLIEGQNVYIQDATAAICVRLSAAPTDLAIGDNITVEGTLGAYNKLPQLNVDAAKCEKVAKTITVTPKAVTIATLDKADLCKVVKLTNVTITEIFDNNGQYTKPNITVSDGTNTVQIYMAIAPAGLAVGDMIDVVASLSCYNDKLQLRNDEATDIVKVVADNDDDNDDTNNDTNNDNNNDSEVKDPDKVGDNTAIVAMTSVMAIAVVALAVLVIGKKRMF